MAAGRAAQNARPGGGRPVRSSRPADDREHEGIDTRSIRPRHDDPEIPESVKPNSLNAEARKELKTLTAENADFVAMHLAMAAQLIEDDPELAHRHAVSASRRGGRIAIVRESLAITAYAVGDYALALRELRTFRRISGRDDQLPMMVDSERGLGRPDRALELGRSVPRHTLPVAVQVELAIAMSGARLDLGDAAAALEELQIPQLDPTTAFSYSPGLFDAHATVLEELGRQSEADEWFRRAEIAAEALGGGDDEFVEVVEEDVEAGDDVTVEASFAASDGVGSDGGDRAGSDGGGVRDGGPDGSGELRGDGSGRGGDRGGSDDGGVRDGASADGDGR